MGMRWWWMIPVLVGLMQPLILQMNLRVSRSTGPMESAVLLHLVGLVAGLCWVWGGLRSEAGWSGLGAIPWWGWLAGALGVTGMAAMNRALPEIGVATASALLVAAQLSAALLLEQLGGLGAQLRVATPERWLGVVLLSIGAWLVSR